MVVEIRFWCAEPVDGPAGNDSGGVYENGPSGLAKWYWSEGTVHWRPGDLMVLSLHVFLWLFTCCLTLSGCNEQAMRWMAIVFEWELITLVLDIHTMDKWINENQIGKSGSKIYMSYRVRRGYYHSVFETSTQLRQQPHQIVEAEKDENQSTGGNKLWFFLQFVNQKNVNHQRRQDGLRRVHETRYYFPCVAWFKLLSQGSRDTVYQYGCSTAIL